MTLPDPSAAVPALQAALSGGPADLEAVSTMAGWMSTSRDAARAFLAQLQRKGLRLQQDGASRSSPERAAVPVTLHDRSDRARGRAWLLLFRAGQRGWSLEAATRAAAHADAFVRAQLPALVRWEDLPDAPELRAHVTDPDPSSPTGALLAALRQHERDPQLHSAVAVVSRQRGAVRLEVDEGDGPRPLYLYFAHGDGGWSMTEHAWAFQLGRLLGDVQGEPRLPVEER